MATIKIAYATSTAITCTVASLASSATVGRECTAVDNTSNLYDDAMVYAQFKTSASALANDKTVYLYFYGSEDGTNYIESATGSDAGFTIFSPSNLRGPFPVSCPSSSTTYKAVVGSVASYFNGVLPRKWGFVVVNYTGQALDSTGGNHALSYTGITYTVA